MKRILVVTSVMLLAATGLVPAALAADPPTEPAAGLADGLSATREWLAGLATHDVLGEPVPLTGVELGGPDALAISSVFGPTGSVQAAIDGVAGGSVADLAAALDGLDGVTPSGVTLDVGVVDVTSGSVAGLDLTLSLSRHLPTAPLVVQDDTAVPAIDIRTGSGSGIPVAVGLDLGLQVRFDDLTDEYYLLADPSLAAVAGIDADPSSAGFQPFEVPPTGFETVVGISEVTVTDASSLALQQSISMSVLDADGNGRLAFREKAADGTTYTPGELTLPKTENVQVTATIDDATGSLHLASSLIPSPATDFDPRIDVGLAGGAITLTPSADYTDTFGMFTSVDATELLGGLGQLANLVDIVQNDPLADVDVPFLDVDLSDVTGLVEPLKALIVDLTQGDDPDTVTNEFGLAEFATVQDLVAAMNAFEFEGSTPFTVGSVAFDPATGLLDLPVTMSQDLPTDFEDITLLQVDPETLGVTEHQLGRVELGDLLRDQLGLDSLAGFVDADDDGEFDVQDGTFVLAPPTGEVRSAFAAALAWGIDLTPSEACDPEAVPNPCDLPHTDLEEFETLPVYQRFFLRDATGPEFSGDTLLQAAGDALRGLAGFVDVTAGPGTLFEVGKVDDGLPSWSLDLQLPSSGITRIQEFTYDFAFSGDDDSGGIVPADLLTVAHNLDASGHLDLSLRGAGNALISLLGNDVIPIDLSWGGLVSLQDAEAGISPGLTVDNLTDGLTQALAGINFDPDDPTAMLGVLLDHLDAVATALDAALGTGDFTSQLPLVSTSIEDLASQFRDLQAVITDIRNADLPDPANPGETLTTPTRLRDLLEQLEGVLGVALPITFEDLGTDGTLEAVLDLAWGRDLETSVPFGLSEALSAAGIPLAGVGAQGEIDVTGQATATLRMPIELAVSDGVPANADVLIDPASGLEVSASAAITHDDELTLNALGTNISVGPGGEAELAVGGAVAYTGSATDPISLADYLASLDVSLTPQSTTPSCEAADEDVDPVTADLLCVNLPIFVDGEPATVNGDDDTDGDGSTADGTEGNDHYLQLAIDSLGGSDPSAHFPEGFIDKVIGDILSFASLTDGLNRLLDVIEAALRGDSFGGALPMFGTDLDGAADIVDDFQTHVVGAIDDVLDLTDATADAVTATDAAFQPLRDALVDSDLLRDVNGGGVDDSDVVVRALCAAGADCVGGTDTVADLTGVEVAFALGQGDPANGDPDACAECVVEEIMFDLGLPALDVVGLGSNATLQAGAGWELEVGFGVSRTEGFYVLENPTALLRGATDDTDPELRVGAFAGLPADTADVLELRFGLLAFGVDTGPGTSAVDLQLTSNLQKPGGSGDDEHILLHELPTLVTQPLKGLNPVVNGSAQLDLELKARANSDLGLPELAASFDFAWMFDSDTFDQVEAPDITLSDVRVELGAVFNETLKPIAQEIRRITEVADPVREFVFAPIPVISDVSRLFGGPDVTFVDLAEVFGDVDLGLLEDINDVLEFVSLLTGSLAEGFVNLSDLIGGSGEITISGDRALGAAPTAGQALGLFSFDGAPATAGGIPSIKDDAADHASDEGQGDASDKVLGSDAFALPFLDQPACIIGMLAKGDCVIVEWTPQDLYLDFEYEQPFGPFFGVLYITVGGHAGAGIQFGMGFSTRGARQAVERSDGFNADLLSGAGAILLEGIFIKDFEGPELYVTAGINAGAKLDVGIAEAGARGGIDATLGFDLIDGPEIDGRVYFDEMKARIFNPLCLFEVVGFLEAFLEVYVEIGVCPFCVEKSFELARVRLLDFTAALAECDATPDLAREETDGNGTQYVRLNMGTDAGHRGVFENVLDEQYVVREIRPPDGGTPGLYSISAFGVTEEHEGFYLSFDAHTGDDVLLFQGTKAGAEGDGDFDEQAKAAGDQAPFLAPVIGTLGSGNDAVTTGDGPDEIHGGTGNDQIATLGGADEIHGEGDDDSIDAGTGDDDPVTGGDGDDTINGGPGADDIDGGDGDDRIDGGRDLVDNGGAVIEADGADTIRGGFDNDVIFAGSGDDDVYGDTEDEDPDDTTSGGDVEGDDDEIHGEDGDDTIWAGPGDDVVLGDEADDPVDGRSYMDTVYGQGGDDVVEGAWEHDELHGGPGTDIMSGTDGADDLFGDGATDHLFGDVLGDVDPSVVPPDVDLAPFQEQLGTPGNDYLDGGPGDDQLHGDDGDDRLRGHTGDDTIQGGAGRDLAVGDDGVITPGPGDPEEGPFSSWSTDVGFDEDDASHGEDLILGGPDDDELHGEGGVDTIRGSAGDDLVFGNGDGDLLHGDTGQDTVYGNIGDDSVEGGPDDDLLVGNAGTDHVYGQAGHDRMIGGSGAGVGEEGVPDTNDASDAGDFLFGGQGTDLGIGDNGEIPDLTTIELAPSGAAAGTFGDDDLNGDADNDTLHGQDGDDDLWGGGGQDQLFGELGDDDLFGQSGEDHLMGDQAVLDGVAHQVTDTEPGGAPVWVVTLVDATAGGQDDLSGGSGDDHLYGGAATDTMQGGLDDDWMEGNGGSDQMYGLSTTHDDGVEQDSDNVENNLLMLGATDQDDMIGGSSDANPDVDKLDEGELVMHGNAQQDVMTGDNANIVRVEHPEDDTQWATDPVTLGRAREVQLLDRERRDPTLLAPVSGADLMLGDAANDRMYGQGDDDLLKGNGADDQLLGNQGRDVLEGNDGDDDLVGGSDLLADTVVDVAGLGLNADAGDPDDGDWLFGGAGADVMAGDNSVIVRIPEDGVAYDHEVDLLGVEDPRHVLWLDKLDPPADENHGSDQLSGGTGVDVQFGQDDRDYLSGGPDDDYQEGNGDSDLVWGDTLLGDLPVDGVDDPIDLPDGGGTVAIPPIVHTLAIDDGHLSGEPALNGGPGPDGQDDQLGGSSLAGFRDAGDFLFGDGAQDFQLGDNGELVRTIEGGAYLTYVDYNPDTFVREATRYDVGPEGDGFSSGDDWLQGDDGDDYQWGQDGDDQLFGDDEGDLSDVGNDDMYGELGDDRMFGGPAEDAMVGDRGLITDTKISDPDAFVSADTQGPAFFLIEGLNVDQLDRRVDLLADGDGDVDGDGDDVEFPGLHHGGRDFMRGGSGHDSMHGAFGSDWMNGDDDGDWLFGADGDDAIWGGRGQHDATDPVAPVVDDDGSDPLYLTYVDFLFGGHGADVLDFHPRPAGDDSIPDDFEEEETVWREITDIDDGDPTNDQDHQGVDWIYGGYDRDVLQGDVGQNGPEEFGDRLVDWVGAFNLYTRCNPSYGDDGDIRQRSPALEDFIHTWAYAAGIGTSVDDVFDPASSAHRELGFVYKSDTRNNNGSAHPGTPGNFFDTACI